MRTYFGSRTLRSRAVALVALASFTACAPRDGGIESVVVVSIDTLRADQLGAWGGTAHTPNLDRLADESLLFERVYTQAPVTHPALSSMWTGLLPSQHGVLTQFHMLRDGVVSVPVVARSAGLRTGAFVANLCMYLDRPGSVLHDGFEARFCGMFDSEDDRREQWEWDRAVVGAGLDWLQTVEGPHLAWLHLMDPHSDHRPPPHLWDWLADPPREGKLQSRHFNDFARSVRRPEPAELERLWGLYRAEVAGVDEALAPLLAHLDRPEVRARTALIVTSDHGEELFESLPYYEHGDSLSEGVLHVPLMLRAPDLEPARVAAPVELLQVAPTVLELLDLPAPYTLAGASLLEPPAAAGPALAQLQGTFGSARDDVHRLWPGSDRPIGPLRAAGPWRVHAPWYHQRGGLAHYGEDGRVALLARDEAATTEARERLEAALYARLDGLTTFGGASIEIDDPELRERLRALGYVDE